MNHDIQILSGTAVSFKARRLIKKAAVTALKSEKISVPCEITVMLTDSEGIREINKRTRDIDSATDVLSFPMFELEPENPLIDDGDIDPDTGRCHLGDMVISVPRAKEQAEQFGHSYERELAYLTVHSIMHLLGYDHMDEGVMKKQMREHEEKALQKMGLTRENEK